MISLLVQRGSSDRRPESWKPDLESMRLGDVIGSGGGWKKRWEIVEPVAETTTTCELFSVASKRGQDAPSLGLVRPVEISDLVVTPNPDYRPRGVDDVDVDLFGTETELLEATPVVAKYRYRCAYRACKGHEQSIVDWESGQFARRNLKHHTMPEVTEMHRRRFLDEICGSTRDTLFYVGNQHQHPASFLVLGLFWPPQNSRPHPTLFD
ncbi:hypothetical protein [Georgenia sp. AZ-5]|uniref:hypothetical protein n=1 Tax=Georgenia sp. AZ-5 TaxID=3367526 RepID=UPI00375439A6